MDIRRGCVGLGCHQVGSWGNPCSQGQDPKSQEHQDTKNDFFLERDEDAGTGVPGTPCTEAGTFLIGNEVLQNPGTLRCWKGNEAMRESYWKPAVNRDERGDDALIRRTPLYIHDALCREVTHVGNSADGSF